MMIFVMFSSLLNLGLDLRFLRCLLRGPLRHGRHCRRRQLSLPNADDGRQQRPLCDPQLGQDLHVAGAQYVHYADLNGLFFT